MFQKPLLSLTVVVLGVLSITTVGHAVMVSPVNGSYTGSLYLAEGSQPLTAVYDGSDATWSTLRGQSGSNDPTGETLTFDLGGDYSLTGIHYLGDNNLGFEQGIANYTLTFFLDGATQGEHSGTFASTTDWQEHTFSAILADQVSLMLDSVYTHGAIFGSLNREFAFEGSVVPIPPAILLFGSGLSGLLFLRRRGV